ncbi:methyltransferase domain-containing protein [Paraburkholderia madseniana]|uniref:SAM-dependent methyltransferase n=1 Tax=Paraburkholderia madseniana TaxID=2599607 RepID=UPI000BDB74A8|nr:methyltransferase domain-containing protein [Paraburkholderia madseniana]NPT69135.1 methyltransferase domain-containing protein [Paraburkholderia madseniana]SOE74919.1 Methyltransferase domain-containing protein [Burkholderia sp. OK233]
MTKADQDAIEANVDDRLISHGGNAKNGYEDRLRTIVERLRGAGDVPGATVEQQVALANELSGFELGRFLLEHRGLNAYWTHRLVTYQAGAATPAAMTALESRIFDALPAVLATRERFGIFRRVLQALLAPGMVLASVPCGVMGELLLLDYAGLEEVELVGVDLDQAALDYAAALADERGLAARVSLHRKDAWSLGMHAGFDVLTSNGLNIYERDDGRVVALYRSFFDALKPGGKLVTSFLTPPPTLSTESPWDMAQIDRGVLALQHLLFVRIIEAQWSAFRTHAQTDSQLREAGFVDIEFIDDRTRMFPTVVARKPL